MMEQKRTYRFIKVDNSNYELAFRMLQTTEFGNVLLPMQYENILWGVIMYEGDNVLALWIGKLRGNQRPFNVFTKCVYFDSLPIWLCKVDKKLESLFLDNVRESAKRDGIIMLNITHWGRGDIQADLKEKSGTFLINLQNSEDELWKKVESKQRNIIRKGEKSGVICCALVGEQALAYLDIFQKLRAKTQCRAIRHNAQSSMLLKNDNFFKELFLHPATTLFVGEVNGSVATVALMIQSGQTVYYYSGGSDYELNKETGSSAYVIWQSILHFKKKQGIKYFDLGGVPVFEDVLNPDKNHPAYGVFQFKRSFGGEYVESQIGKFIINTFKYNMLNFILKQRKLLRIFSKLGI